MARFLLWLWRLLLVAIVAVVCLNLPEPLDIWFGTLMSLILTIWIYNRVAQRLNRRPFHLKFEKVETITLTHVLMGMILLLMVAGFSELVSIKNGTIDIQSSITNLQNQTSNNADEIKGKLDDVMSAVEANQ